MTLSIHRPRGGLSIGATMLAIFVFVIATTASAAQISSGSVLSASRTAIDTQSGVHVVFTAHSGSTGIAEEIVADVGTTAGSETIFEGSADVAIKLTPTFAYVSGNQSGLTTLFGMSSAIAKKLGDRWESWKVGTGRYKNLESDLTMRSVTTLLPRAKGSKASTVVRHGMTMYLLTWNTPKSGSVPKLSNSLVVSAQGPALPSLKSAIASDGTKITTALSKWGESVGVQAPPSNRTISSSKLGN
jgi:hypothetical protein